MSPEDLSALRQLSDCYADAVDRRDGAALVRLFAPDGRLSVQRDGGEVEAEWTGTGVDGILAAVDRYERTFHQVGGCVFEQEGEGASGRVHLTAHHYERTANGPVDLVMLIVYHDQYSRGPDRWAIQDRRVAVEWTELHAAHPRRRSGA